MRLTVSYEEGCRIVFWHDPEREFLDLLNGTRDRIFRARQIGPRQPDGSRLARCAFHASYSGRAASESG